MKNDKGDLVAFMGTIQDITERKRNEEALRVSEQQMFYATTAADIGCKEIFGYSPDHPITYQAF